MPPTLTLTQLAQVAAHLYSTPFTVTAAPGDPTLLGTLQAPDRALTIAQDDAHLYLALTVGTDGQGEDETLTELFATCAERLFPDATPAIA